MSKQRLFNPSEDSREVKKIEDCFIITPIGSQDSEIYKKTTGLLEAVIQPVLSKLGFKAIPAHKIAAPGSIPKQILRHIVEDKLVIANLTGLNPNVMYELAVRHAVKLPLVMLAEFGTDLPFDVKDQRTIFYSDTFVGVEACKNQLEAAINMVLKEGYEAENPIYDAIETNTIIKNIAPESNDEYFVNRLDSIETAINSLVNNNRQNLPKIWVGDLGSDVFNSQLAIRCNKDLDTTELINGVSNIVKPFGIDFEIGAYDSHTLTLSLRSVSTTTKQLIKQEILKLSGIEKVLDIFTPKNYPVIKSVI